MTDHSLVHGTYILGVALAILSGVLNQVGQILQKKVVNEVRDSAGDKGFMRSLLMDPVWLLGFVIAMGGGTVAFMLAQGMIGPALVPGLMASGLIVLALGSVKMNQETLDRAESAGIGLMILGILLLGLSELDISTDQVRQSLALSETVSRITVFTLTLAVLWVATHALALRSRRRSGIILAVSNGFPFCLSNFWISPLLAVVFIVMSGKGDFAQAVVMAVASVILVGANVLGTWQTQMAFKFAQASNVIPVQQVPIQITPILVYFYVFSLTPPRTISVVYMMSGVGLIIVSGFLLGRRQNQLEAAK